MAYTGIDKEIYESGTHFRPLQKYTQQKWTPPAIMGQNTNAGITSTDTAQSYKPPYIWPPVSGGGGGGPDETEEDNFSMGMSPGALGGKLPGFGNWAKRTAGTVGHIYSKLPTPGNILKKIITTGTDKYNDWKTQQEEEEAERQAITRDRINQKIINTGIYKKTYIPPGADRHPDDPTDRFGGKGHPDAPTSPPDQGGWHPGVGGNGGGGLGTDTPAEPGGWGPGAAQGGRIGYGLGDIVKGWFSGGPESETNPTLFGTQNSLMNKTAIDNLENAIGLYETQIENADQLGHLSKEDMLKYELAKKQLEALIAGSKGQAEGGLIGYFDGGIVRLL